MHAIPLGPLIKIAAIIIGCYILREVVLFLRRKGGSGGNAYQRKGALFTPAELSFLGVLEMLVDEQTAIYGKVRLADLFDVKKELGTGRYYAAFRRISQKHVDFVFVRRSDGVPYLGIELDDASHFRVDRMERDAFVEQVFKGASLPLLRIKCQRSYHPEEVRQRLADALASG